MTLRFASLGSGSRGNAMLVEFESTLLMVDCGLPLKIVEERLRLVGREPRAVSALLVMLKVSRNSRAATTRRCG